MLTFPAAQIFHEDDGSASVKHVSTLQGHSKTVNCVRFSPSGKITTPPGYAVDLHTHHSPLLQLDLTSVLFSSQVTTWSVVETVARSCCGPLSLLRMLLGATWSRRTRPRLDGVVQQRCVVIWMT